MIGKNLGIAIVIAALVSAALVCAPKIRDATITASGRHDDERRMSAAIAVDDWGRGACSHTEWGFPPSVFIAARMMAGDTVSIAVRSRRTQWSLPDDDGGFAPVVITAPRRPFSDQHRLVDAITLAHARLGSAGPFCIVLRFDGTMSVRDAYAVALAAQQVHGADITLFQDFAF